VSLVEQVAGVVLQSSTTKPLTMRPFCTGSLASMDPVITTAHGVLVGVRVRLGVLVTVAVGGVPVTVGVGVP
jgi:hypothetical protein